MFFKIVFFLLLITIASSTIPPFIHVCGLRNPKLNECISESIIALREKLSHGIPELNIPSTKAFVLNDLTFINQTDLNISSKKAIIYGVDNFTLTYLNLDFKNQSLFSLFQYKYLEFEADCDIIAKILVPINGMEKIISTAHNITVDIKSHFEMIKKNNKTFVYFNSINIKMTIADLDAKIPKTAENENSVIVMAMNTILGTNKADITRAIVSNIEKSISINLINIINNIVTNYELDELFPDRE